MKKKLFIGAGIITIIFFFGIIYRPYIRRSVRLAYRWLAVTQEHSEKQESPLDDVYGIDISAYNSIHDWDAVTASFIYVKASEGTTIQDPKCKEYLQQARKHNIPVGAYHFFCTSSSAKTQFQNFKKQAPRDKVDLIPVIDIEKQTTGHKKSIADLQSMIQEFADSCESYYGKKPIIYSGDGFYGRYLHPKFKAYPYWCGNVGYSPKYKCIIHQARICSVPGAGKVDYNVLYEPLNKIRL